MSKTADHGAISTSLTLHQPKTYTNDYGTERNDPKDPNEYKPESKTTADNVSFTVAK